MILLLGGTTEGRELAVNLAQRGFPILLTVATEYGNAVMKDTNNHEPNIQVIVGRQNKEQLKQMIQSHQIQMVIDLTHPHAYQVTKTAFEAATEENVPFIRYERPQIEVDALGGEIIWVRDVEEAANCAHQYGKSVFLATGSKHIEAFTRIGIDKEVRYIVRVLPNPAIIQHCLTLGIKSSDIIAMQGPFSASLNQVLLKEFGAQVMVTKESGDAGGFLAKVEACHTLKIPLIVIKRPDYIGIPLISDEQEMIRICESSGLK